jgi:hypothetical protein
MPFCNECGEKMPDAFVYMICDGCFKTIRDLLLNPPEIPENQDTQQENNHLAFSILEPVPNGFCGYAYPPKYASPVFLSYFVYSDRAVRFEKAEQVEQMRKTMLKEVDRKRGRLIRF